MTEARGGPRPRPDILHNPVELGNEMPNQETAAGTRGTNAPADPRHWKTERNGKGILWLTLDKADAGANTLSEDVFDELETILGAIETDLPTAVIIRSGKANGFIAGADIGASTTVQNADMARALVRRGQGVMDRIAALKTPTVAMIHGFCLGGGLELALACRYRIARKDASLGFPEVMLGIHPGFGGTVRATRLLPAPTAMNLMLTGRTVDARAAMRLGLVDVVTEQRYLETAARDAALNGLRVKRRRLQTMVMNSAPVRPVIARIMRNKTQQKVRPDHYPAPYALIDLWAKKGGDAKAMLKAEADSVATLMTGDVARNLFRAFFLRERLKGLGRAVDFAVRRVHVIGAGTMGGDIAAWCALKGLTVTLQDQTAEPIASALKRAAGLFRKELRGNGAVREALDRLQPDLAGDGVARADVVIEAIIENREAKQALFKKIAPHLKEGALLATNTSSIPLEELAQSLDAPGRLAGLHFFNPVAKMPLIEVIRGNSTDAASVDKGLAFGRRIDRLALPVKSAPGFLVNRVLMPYLLEAVVLLEEDVPAARIDAAAESFGMPMGPLELADKVGLDICLDVAEILAEAVGTSINVPGTLREMVERGEKGVKSGKGFYLYRDGKPEKVDRIAAATLDAELTDRLILPLINACVLCLGEGVVEDSDFVDAGIIFGTGFAPFRGGPMAYARTRGPGQVRDRLGELERHHGERFRPDAHWPQVFGK